MIAAGGRRSRGGSGEWRTIVGREAVWGHALISRGIERFGEDVMPEIWEEILRPLFERRYRKFDVSLARWNTELLWSCFMSRSEAERTWLSTPDRDGAPIEIDELEYRWIMRFDPCGTGGRALRGYCAEGTPSRTQPPYGFPVIVVRTDWTDRMSGVCCMQPLPGGVGALADGQLRLSTPRCRAAAIPGGNRARQDGEVPVDDV